MTDLTALSGEKTWVKREKRMKRMHDMYALGGAILCYFVLIFVTFDLKRGVVRLLNVWDIYLFLGRLMTRATRLFFFLLFYNKCRRRGREATVAFKSQLTLLVSILLMMFSMYLCIHL